MDDIIKEKGEPNNNNNSFLHHNPFIVPSLSTATPNIILTPIAPVSPTNNNSNNNNDNEGRVLRPKEKRKQPSYLTNSITIMDDAEGYNTVEWQFNPYSSSSNSPSLAPPSSSSSSAATKKRVRAIKEEKVLEEAKVPKKRGRKAKGLNPKGVNNNKQSSSFSPPNTPPFNNHNHGKNAANSPVQSDDDTITLVIDDPDSTYPDLNDHEEEIRRKSRRVQQLPPSPFLTSATTTPIENAEVSLADESEEENNNEDENGKKKKRHPAAVQIKKYQAVPLDSNNHPIMPIILRGLTVESLGRVVSDSKKFHAKRYIWPLGFKSRRFYSSMTNLNLRCEYVSEITILDDEPRFTVTCLENPLAPTVIEATTPSGAWAEVGKRVNDLKEEFSGRRVFTQLSGPEMFGFSHPTIAKLIQDLPNAHMCEKYDFQKFELSNVPYLGKESEETEKIEIKAPTTITTTTIPSTTSTSTPPIHRSISSRRIRNGKPKGKFKSAKSPDRSIQNIDFDDSENDDDSGEESSDYDQENDDEKKLDFETYSALNSLISNSDAIENEHHTTHFENTTEDLDTTHHNHNHTEQNNTLYDMNIDTSTHDIQNTQTHKQHTSYSRISQNTFETQTSYDEDIIQNEPVNNHNSNSTQSTPENIAISLPPLVPTLSITTLDEDGWEEEEEEGGSVVE